MAYRRFLTMAVFIAALLLATVLAAGAASVPRMTTDELKSRLGEADLVVLDVRGSWDWDKAAEKIAGSVRVNPAAVEQWASSYPREKTLVLYCA